MHRKNHELLMKLQNVRTVKKGTQVLKTQFGSILKVQWHFRSKKQGCRNLMVSRGREGWGVADQLGAEFVVPFPLVLLLSSRQ